MKDTEISEQTTIRVVNQKSKFTACMIALFLGGMGFQRFYLGRNVSGLFCLLFFWTLIPAIIAVFDFFVLAFMSNEKFHKRYTTVTIIEGGKNG